MKRRACCLLVLITAIYSLQAVAAPTEPEALTVAAILPLTGPLTEYGVAFKNGVELAQLDHPELLKHIAFRYEDSRYDATTAVTAFKKLQQENTSRIVFVWGNPTSEAVAPLAERSQTPMIALVMNPAVSIGKKYVIRSASHAAMFSRRLASGLQEMRCKKIGVVLAENSYLNGVLEVLRAEMGPKSSIVVIDNYAPGDNDFRTSMTKIKSSGYDCVGVFLMSGQIAQFYRQLAQQHLDVRTFGTDFFESSTEIAAAGGAMDGAVYAHIGVSDAFRKKYIERYKNDLQLAYAGNGYDMAVLLAEAAQKVGRAASPDEIMEALRSPAPRNGVSGSFHYKESTEGGAYYEFPIYLKQIKGASFETIAH